MLDIPLAIGNTFVVACQATWMTLRIAAYAVWNFPLRSAFVAAFVAAAVVWSLHTATGIYLDTILAIVVWWAVGRALDAIAGKQQVRAGYQLVVGQRLYSAWRRWWLYERRWQRTLAGQHLTRIIDDGYDDVPGLSKVRVTRAGDIVRVKVLPGQTTRDYTGMDGETARSLAKAFQARECIVTDIPQTDYITLWLPRGKDPLAHVAAFPGIPESTADVDLRAIPIGVDERGKVVTVPVLGAHVLTGGLTGAGKGSVMWSILLHLIPFIKEGSVVLHGIDPKRGVELKHAPALFNGGLCIASNGKDIADFLKPLIKIMDDSADRLTAAGLRKLTPTPEHPLHIVVIDELGRLSDDKDCQALIKTIVNVGRAPGMSALGFLQQPTKETVKSRDEWPVKVALKLESRDYVKMLLGRVAYLAGARCDEIPLSMPGVGYVKIDELADELNDVKPLPFWLRWLPWNRGQDVQTSRPPARFRAYWVSNELIAEANRSMGGADDEQPVGLPAADVDSDAEELEDADVIDDREYARDRRGRFAGAPTREDDPTPDSDPVESGV
jgi:S-DNA-T family DNA segregation ATPase FtsK/SpoIIIE